MFEEAVALALQIDLELAKAEANKVEDDELRKKLWLMIARHVIEQERDSGRNQQEEEKEEGENIRRAIAFLKDTDGLLKIEDILPFFPDFTRIDDFKDAIRSSLEEYNRQIVELKDEMQEAARGADNIRKDISSLSQRYAIVGKEETCGICRKLLLAGRVSRGSISRFQKGAMATSMAPFYVFPCGHGFHADCLTAHVLEHSGMGEKEHVMELKRRLSLMLEETQRERRSRVRDEEGELQDSTASVDKVRAQLDDAVAGDCPFCGDLMIRLVSEPFVHPEETGVDTWEIGHGQGLVENVS